MIIKTVLIALWIITALLEGARDGFFYNYKNNSSKTDSYNMHWLFTFERTVIMVLICWINIEYSSILNTAVLADSLILIFSFFHNGQYYWTRNFLDKKVYPKKWFDASKTSTSVIELNSRTRIILAIIGFVGLWSTYTFR